MSDNKDTLLALMSQIPNVTAAETDVVPDGHPQSAVEGALTFRCHYTDVDGRDRRAEMYIVPSVYEDPINNTNFLAYMTELVDYLQAGRKIDGFTNQITPEPPTS